MCDAICFHCHQENHEKYTQCIHCGTKIGFKPRSTFKKRIIKGIFFIFSLILLVYLNYISNISLSH